MVTAVGSRAIRPASNHKGSPTVKSTTTKPPKHFHQKKRAHSSTNLIPKAMWLFPGYHGYYPPVYAYYPTPYASTSCLDRRTNTRSICCKQTLLGSGANHHDLISFSLTNAKEPSDETLIGRNPVRDHHFKDLQTSRLEALFEELSDLQESRVGQPDEEFDEFEMRQMTLDTLAEVLQRRKQWSGDDDGVDLDGDKEDD